MGSICKSDENFMDQVQEFGSKLTYTFRIVTEK